MSGVSVADAVRAVKTRTAIVPDVAVILGTGLGALADELKADVTIPYAEIPGFPRPTVETHAVRLLFGPASGLSPSRLMWSEMRTRSPVDQSGCMPPETLETISVFAPSARSTRTGNATCCSE